MEKYYNYLNSLRDTGLVNMFGAAIYLENDFGLSKQEAKEILLKWMKEGSDVE